MERTWRVAISTLIALGTLSTAACLVVEEQDVEWQDKVPDPSTEPEFKSSCPEDYTLAGTVEVECDNFSVGSASLDSGGGDWRNGKCYVRCTCSGTSENPPAAEICPYPNVMASSEYGDGCPTSWSSPGQETEVPGIPGAGWCSSSDFGLDTKEQACDNHCANKAPFSATFTCCSPIDSDAGVPDAGTRDGGIRDGGVSDAGRDGGSDGGARDGGIRDGGVSDAGRDGGSDGGIRDGGSGPG